MAHPELLDEIHTSILERHGSVESYLGEACALDRATLQQLRTLLLA